MSIKKAVVLSAGEGKRLRPLTYTRPKCMIQLAGKPILYHVINSLADAGIGEIIAVVKYQSKTITDYFTPAVQSELGVKIQFIEQGDNYGTAAAFLEAEKYIDEPFIGMAGDIITDSNAISRLMSGFEGQAAACFKQLGAAEEQYGTAVIEGGIVKGFEEKSKSSRSNLVNCSIYAFGPEIFRLLSQIRLSKRKEYEVTDLFSMADVKAVVLEDEYWLDMGMPWQLFNANEFLLSQLPGKRGIIEDSTIKGPVYMEEGARIFASYVEGPLYLGKNSEIGPHSYIKGVSSIGNDCSIGDSTTVKNSIIFDNVNAKHLSYIGDSIIGANCNFGAGTQIANYRFDEGSITSLANDVVIDTKRNKLGAILGDNTKTGVLSSVMPGKVIGDNCWIGANVNIDRHIGRNKSVRLKQELVIEERKSLLSLQKREPSEREKV